MKKFSPRNNNRRIRRLGVEGSIFVLLQPRYSIPSKEFFPLLPMSFFFSFSPLIVLNLSCVGGRIHLSRCTIHSSDEFRKVFPGLTIFFQETNKKQTLFR